MSKYDPLRHHLSSLKGNVWRASFREIEAILGFPVPKSAYTYNAWWANEKHGSHTHATAWMKAGWKTESVNLTAGRVVFRRAGLS